MILIQPDLGVALICVPIFAGIAFVAGLRTKTIALLLVLGVLGGVLGFQFGLRSTSASAFSRSGIQRPT